MGRGKGLVGWGGADEENVVVGCFFLIEFMSEFVRQVQYLVIWATYESFFGIDYYFHLPSIFFSKGCWITTLSAKSNRKSLVDLVNHLLHLYICCVHETNGRIDIYNLWI